MSAESLSLFMGLCASVLLLAFGVAGLILIIVSVRNRRKAQASQAWPGTTGRILEAGVRVNREEDEDGTIHVNYLPAVVYEYRVGDRLYTGRQLSFGTTGSSNRAKAEAWIARYPEGSQVTVYYNPDRPEEAVLERKAPGFSLGLAIGIFFLLLGLGLGCPILAGMTGRLFAK